ncbi:hypothetical protein VTH06DRAFT_2823 [Thermothelomyces fergusii]
MTLLMCFCDKIMIFVEQLSRYASSGRKFLLSKLITNLTFDIICAITMDVDFDARQSKSSGQGEFIKLYLLDMDGTKERRFPWWIHPTRKWRCYKVGKSIDRHPVDMIRRNMPSNSSKIGNRKGEKPARETLRHQLKTFLFAGHDTTGILLMWLFYELSPSPHVLKAVRDGSLMPLYRLHGRWA